MNTYFEPAREIKVRAEVDVLVVGAGPAGLMAAEAAAKNSNLKVMLLESRGFLGGNLILGLILVAFFFLVIGKAIVFILVIKNKSEHCEVYFFACIAKFLAGVDSVNYSTHIPFAVALKYIGCKFAVMLNNG